MPAQLDDVVITRAVSNRQRRPSSPAATTTRGPRKQEETPKLPEGSRNILIIALLLGVFSLLLLLAMVSYSTRDAANAEMSFREIIAVLKGNAELSARIDTTQNWLGLLGAVVANILYNGTFGVCALSIPLILGWWSKELFLRQSISRPVLERSGLVMLSGVIASGFFGTLQLISWLPTLPREWSGAAGSFLAIMLTRFTGIIGSMFITGVALFFSVAFTAKVDLVELFKTISERSKELWEYLQSLRTVTDDSEAVGEEDVETVDENQSTEAVEEIDQPKSKAKRQRVSDKEKGAEPARFLRKNLQPENTLPLFDAEPTIIRPEIRDEYINESEAENADGQVTGDDASATTSSLRGSLRGSDGLIHGIPGAPAYSAMQSAEDADQNDDAEEDGDEDLESFANADELDGESSNTDGMVTRNAALRLQVEEVHFDDDAKDVDQTDIYDEMISYVPPGMDLLDKYPAEHLADDDELKSNALILKEKLETFKIKIEDVTVTPGPVITQYEFVPAAGVKISQIESLSDDIALALKAKGIRIIAPVPGKGTVGVEIPNHKPSVVHFSSIITSKTFNDNDKQLPIALGKTIIGETFCTDLAKLPHLLIAGSTGSGKSVGVNAILMSLIYKVHPRDLKFVIIDPKKVEMSLYAGLKNHFLASSPDVDESIVTSPQNAALVLKSLCMEMDQRYAMLAACGKRKITEFNAMVAAGTSKDKSGKVMRPLPYIVVIIDELADLMITARNEVEEPIIRLAQLARAVGIHLVVATQRPSVDVITGLIKANFPARIAYQVASKIDSRTILDSSGAEQLLGNGDMLFTHGGVKPMRLQNSFVSTEEVEAITGFISAQMGYSSPYMLPSVLAVEGVNKVLSGDRDPLFQDAASIVIKTQQASTSFLQRRLKVGYSRAARIVDELEYAGIVGPAEGSKPRVVLLDSEAELERIL
ncbi:MAG: hypothetical protein RL156_1800 [Bacteroidota bacterium]